MKAGYCGEQACVSLCLESNQGPLVQGQLHYHYATKTFFLGGGALAED